MLNMDLRKKQRVKGEKMNKVLLKLFIFLSPLFVGNMQAMEVEEEVSLPGSPSVSRTSESDNNLGSPSSKSRTRRFGDRLSPTPPSEHKIPHHLSPTVTRTPREKAQVYVAPPQPQPTKPRTFLAQHNNVSLKVDDDSNDNETKLSINVDIEPLFYDVCAGNDLKEVKDALRKLMDNKNKIWIVCEGLRKAKDSSIREFLFDHLQSLCSDLETDNGDKTLVIERQGERLVKFEAEIQRHSDKVEQLNNQMQALTLENNQFKAAEAKRQADAAAEARRRAARKCVIL